MEKQVFAQRIIEISKQDYFVLLWAEAFIKDRQAAGLSKSTLHFYQDKLQAFIKYCDSQLIKQVTEITPNTIRDYLLGMQASGHNPGGCHAAFRTIRAFLLWFESEAEPEAWKNPIRKLHAPRVALEPLDPANPADIANMLEDCPRTLSGIRDRAILLTLVDTGCRASEFLQVDLNDIDLITGSILLRVTKGKKPRTVFISKQTRKAIRLYLGQRNDKCPALWINNERERLQYNGLRAIMTRRANQAKVKPPSLHSFRRLYAITMLRNGVDVYSLQRLLGHSDLQILRRYLKQDDTDLRAAHTLGDPTNILKQ